MEKIQHKFVLVNGLKIHVAAIGGINNSLPAVVFLHGFPDIAYSWRHQMKAVAKAGYRAVAPDFRGFGLSDPPPEHEKTTFSDLVSDVLVLLQALSIRKAILIAKDFGVHVAYRFAHLHPRRVSGIASVGVPFIPQSPSMMKNCLPESSYILRWQEPGRAEADFSRFDAKTVVRKIYTLFSRGKVPIAKENQEILDLVDSSTPLPSWFTEADLAEYGAMYEKSGFRTALQVAFRSFNEDFVDIANLKIKAPQCVIIGGKDYTKKLPGAEKFMKNAWVKVKKQNKKGCEVSDLVDCSHFMQEQFPDLVNWPILGFVRNCK